MTSGSYSGEIVIPENIKYGVTTYSVTEIGDSAFNGCSGLTSITIPSSVTWIRSRAFKGCSGLTSITIPSSVTAISSSAFEGCTGLTSISIPSSVTEIGVNAFNGCSGLTSITIPSSVTIIYDNAFKGCTGLTSITIPSSVTEIGSSAFKGCTGLTSITIPSSVTSIGYEAFLGCSGLTSITIPSSVTWIGGGAFYDCTSLTSITIPSSVTSIGDNAFDGCSSLTSIEIPSSVTSIGDDAFSGCSSLTSIEMPSSLTSIGDWAFSGCSSLTSIEIPSSVTSIGEYAFGFCSSLMSVTCLTEDPPTAGSDCFSEVPGKAVLYVPTGAKEKYASAVGWSRFVKIAEFAFSSPTVVEVDGVYYNLNKADGTCSVTSGDNKYEGEIAIPEIIFTYSVTSIDAEAFSGCSGLTHVEIPSTVTEIGSDAFSGCTRLTSVTCLAEEPPTAESGCFSNIPAGAVLYVPIGTKEKYESADQWKDFATIEEFDPTVTTVEVDGLYYELNKTLGTCSVSGENKDEGEIVIPEKITYCGRTYPVTSIGRAFAYCSNLKSVKIPSSVTSIGGDAFYLCTNLTSITVNENNACYASVDGVLYNKDITELIRCPEGKTSIDIPSSVTSIGNSAFEECTGLTSIEIPSSVTMIGNSAFEECTSLTSIEIPSSVTSIGRGAFYECTNLTSVTCLAEEPPTVGDSSFYPLAADAVLYVPTGTKEKYESADQWKDFATIMEIDPSSEALTDVIFDNDGPNTIFDLNGRKLAQPRRGINIINGKKVLVK